MNITKIATYSVVSLNIFLWITALLKLCNLVHKNVVRKEVLKDINALISDEKNKAAIALKQEQKWAGVKKTKID